MKTVIPFIFSVLLLMLAPGVGSAQSTLSKMPFDINVGVTKNAEIEDKGVCVAKIKTADSVSHCIRYSMSNDKFSVYANPEGTIIKISFLAVSHHALPQNWAALGLRLASSYRYRKAKQVANPAEPSKPIENEAGNSQQEVLDIIQANGAQNITRKLSYSSDYQVGEHISFTIGRLHYTAEFIKWVRPKWCDNCPTYTDYDNGLVSIEIIEEQ